MRRNIEAQGGLRECSGAECELVFARGYTSTHLGNHLGILAALIGPDDILL